MDQIREIARDTFYTNNNNNNNDQSELTREKQRLNNYSIMLLTQELEKLSHIENNNNNDNSVEDSNLNMLQENQNKARFSSQAMTYGEFMADLEYIKKQHNWNEEEHSIAQDSYSIIGNAELEMEKESRYPEKILPQDFQQEGRFYKKPGQINQKLFTKVKDRMMRQKL